MPKDQAPNTVMVQDDSAPVVAATAQSFNPSQAPPIGTPTALEHEPEPATNQNATAAHDAGDDSEIEITSWHKAAQPGQNAGTRATTTSEDEVADQSMRGVKRERSEDQVTLIPAGSIATERDGKKVKTQQQVAFEMEEARIVEQCALEEARARRDRKLAEARIRAGLVEPEVKSEEGA